MKKPNLKAIGGKVASRVKKEAKRLPTRLIAADRRGARLADDHGDPNADLSIGQRIRGAVYSGIEDATLGKMGPIGRAIIWKWRGDKKAFKREAVSLLSRSTLGRMGGVGDAMSAHLSRVFNTYDNNPDISDWITRGLSQNKGKGGQVEQIVQTLEKTGKAIDKKFEAVRKGFDEIEKGYRLIDKRLIAFEQFRDKQLQKMASDTNQKFVQFELNIENEMDNNDSQLRSISSSVTEHESKLIYLEGQIDFLKKSLAQERLINQSSPTAIQARSPKNDNNKKESSWLEDLSSLVSRVAPGAIAGGVAGTVISSGALGAVAGALAGAAPALGVLGLGAAAVGTLMQFGKAKGYNKDGSAITGYTPDSAKKRLAIKNAPVGTANETELSPVDANQGLGKATQGVIKPSTHFRELKPIDKPTIIAPSINSPTLSPVGAPPMSSVPMSMNMTPPSGGGTYVPSSSSGTSVANSGATQVVATSQPQANTIAGKTLIGGATLPKNIDQNTIAALNEVSSKHGLKPEAIAMMIDTESKWNSKNTTGSYSGLTQVGNVTIKEMVNSGKLPQGFNRQTLLKMSKADQIKFYDKWLEHYNVPEKMNKYGVDPSNMTSAQQAAFLQGVQFAPNKTSWYKGVGSGANSVRATHTRQARVLGNTSYGDMTNYYNRISEKSPGIYADAEVQTASFNTNNIIGFNSANKIGGNTVTAGLSMTPQEVLKRAVEGKIDPSSKAVDIAADTLGLHERKDRKELQNFLKYGGDKIDPSRTAWCGAFVNSALAQAGVKGPSGRLIANNWQKWGEQVKSPKDIRKGDVIVQTRGKSVGQTGGHVGFATGKTRMKNGRLQYEMLGGNQGLNGESSVGVSNQWVYADRNVMVRRNNQKIEESSDVGAPIEPVFTVPQMPSKNIGVAVPIQKKNEIGPQGGIISTKVAQPIPNQTVGPEGGIVSQPQPAFSTATAQLANETKIADAVATPMPMPPRFEPGSLAPKDTPVVSPTESPSMMEQSKDSLNSSPGENVAAPGTDTSDSDYIPGTSFNPESAAPSPGDIGYGAGAHCLI